MTVALDEHHEYFVGTPVLLLNRTPQRAEEGFHALNRTLKLRVDKAAGVRWVE